MIFTSGSTGQPKGVVVEHHSVVRLVRNTNYIEIAPEDRILQSAPLSFDASTFEIWGALLNGASLRLPERREMLDVERVGAIVRDDRITVMWLTASLFNQFVDRDIRVLSGLRALIVGGEALSPAHVGRFRSEHPGTTLINGYGPTEEHHIYVLPSDRRGRRRRHSDWPADREHARGTCSIVAANRWPLARSERYGWPVTALRVATSATMG